MDKTMALEHIKRYTIVVYKEVFVSGKVFLFYEF
jgi:hypothetical protein